jgi:hypothetical protein
MSSSRRQRHCHRRRYHLAEMTSPLPRWCANAASSLTRTSASDITLMSSLRDFFFAALRQLRSILCHVSVPMISLVTSLILARLDYCNSVLFGLPDVLVSLLQSFQNCCSCGLQSSSDALICLHWLQVPEHIRFKVAVLVYCSLQGTSPQYRRTFTQTSAIAARSNLRSVSRLQLVAPRCRLSSLGDRAFPVSGATVWNELPTDITSALLASAFPLPPENFSVLSLISRRSRLVVNSSSDNGTCFF